MLNLILVFSLLLTSFASAANKYVAPGGSGNGSSWSSPASPAIINSSAAGDVVYLAGGSYGGGIPVSASGSASAQLTIKRATASDHGSDTGWSANMDKQATFDSGWSVTGRYITIDGNTWKPPGLPTTFGIKIAHGSGSKGIDAGGSAGNMVIRNIAIPGPGINSSKAEADGVHFSSNTTISGCAVYDTDALLFAWKGTGGVTIEYCVLYNVSSNIVISGNPQDPHPDVIYSGGMLTNSTVRWCLISSVTSEGIFFDRELPGDNFYIYGCVMIQADCQTGNTPVQFQNDATFGNSYIYNNTWVDFNKSNVVNGSTLGPKSQVINNLFVNYLPNWPVGVNNNGFSSTGIGTNQIINSVSPFVTTGDKVWVKGSGNPPATRVTTGAPVGYDPTPYLSAFQLAPSSWAKGKAIAVPSGYNTDMFGRTGNDLGALQSGGAAPTPTPAPTATPNPSATPAPTASPSPVAKFKAGDTVTPATGTVVNVRNSAGGSVVGQHNPGDIGTVVSGPEVAPMPQATNVNWYLITWTTAPASGYSGDDDLVKTTAPAPTPTPTPTPGPTPVPTPLPTYEKWMQKQNDWIRANPPYPDAATD